jgi:hypothetical protein
LLHIFGKFIILKLKSSRLCAPLLADLFLYSYEYESEFLQKLVKDKKIHEAKAFNFTHRYSDDVLSIYYSRFASFLPLIYPQVKIEVVPFIIHFSTELTTVVNFEE